ncbi:hypothetical protein [Mycobacterium marinum]|uniref:hypothetical protein n=1 Tax=Mycobacterium marinum TaxID=1781 RepID=UPI0023591961|nr:hypothetical protein [Mycobacterium marinum]MDC8985577.1 hypothetical protein [Mycobacterium marinum]MDC9002874.1 hypothetical protein [Mycobacterium marinum]MDC9013611.1 hypothetical protein [Mycobacterium marinum]MDC9018964.1 hypothetical protein [Mycobacterium marinum]
MLARSDGFTGRGGGRAERVGCGVDGNTRDDGGVDAGGGGVVVLGEVIGGPAVLCSVVLGEWGCRLWLLAGGVGELADPVGCC